MSYDPTNPSETFNFSQPFHRQDLWHEDWYHNFDILEDELIATDVRSNRDQYHPTEERIFLASDTGEIFVGTGSGWASVLEPLAGDNLAFSNGQFHAPVVNEDGQLVGIPDHDHSAAGEGAGPLGQASRVPGTSRFEGIDAQSGSVADAPVNDTDIARLLETSANADAIDSLDASKAPLDGGGSASLSNYDTVEAVTQLTLPVYSDDANAPASTYYFNDTANALRYKDSSGTIHYGEGLSNPLDRDLDANQKGITNAHTVGANLVKHRNTIDTDHTIEAGEGAVIAGELSGSGSVSGEGSLAVIDEGIHNALLNPLEEPLDAGGQPITNAGSVETEEAQFGSSAVFGSGSRPLVSNEDKILYVDGSAGDDSNDGSEGSPLATIQAAVDRIPYYLRHRWEISVAAGTYDEDVYIPATHGSSYNHVGLIIITGDQTTPTNVSVNSFTADQHLGQVSPKIQGFEITGTDVRDGDRSRAGILFRNCNEPQVRNVVFSGVADRCIEAYTSHLNVRGTVDFGTDRDIGVIAKRGGSVFISRSDTSIEGSVTNAVYVSYENSLIVYSTDVTTATGGNGLTDASAGGRLIESSTDPTLISPDITKALTIDSDDYTGLRIQRDGTVVLSLQDESNEMMLEKITNPNGSQIRFRDHDYNNILVLTAGGPVETPHGFQTETRSDDPASPDDGRIWYRTDLDEYRGSEGGAIVSFDTTAI